MLDEAQDRMHTLMAQVVQEAMSTIAQLPAQLSATGPVPVLPDAASAAAGSAAGSQSPSAEAPAVPAAPRQGCPTRAD
eukprot:9308693-Prorocentrum_lima.AAC.1